MSGDWIKMRADLFTHPKVIRISSALKADKLRTVGGLMSVWCLFDAHSENGVLVGYTTEAIDSHLGWSGFSSAMLAVGWLEIDGESVALPRFETHNGASSKRRAQDSDRKRNVRKLSANEADTKRTREEKIREENKKKDQEPRAGEEEKGEQPTAAGLACRAIMAKGIQANPSHPDLLAAITEGTTAQEFADAAAECKSKGKGFAYLLAMVRRRKAETAAPVTPIAPKPREVAKPERRLSDDERKRTLGENLPAILKQMGVT